MATPKSARWGMMSLSIESTQMRVAIVHCCARKQPNFGTPLNSLHVAADLGRMELTGQVDVCIPVARRIADDHHGIVDDVAVPAWCPRTRHRSLAEEPCRSTSLLYQLILLLRRQTVLGQYQDFRVVRTRCVNELTHQTCLHLMVRGPVVRVGKWLAFYRDRYQTRPGPNWVAQPQR